MKLVRKIRFWLGGLFCRGRFNAEMEDELQMHIELRTDKNIAAGMSPQEAHYAALRDFGRVEQVKEQARDQRNVAWVEHLLRDLRFAVRMIWAHRWFSAAVIVTLALGIGINTTVFTLVNAVLFKPLPIPGGERIVTIAGQNLKKPGDSTRISYPDFREFRTQNRTFEGIESARLERVVLSDRYNLPERREVGRVSAGMFSLLRIPPMLGRDFTVADDRPGAEDVVLLG